MNMRRQIEADQLRQAESLQVQKKLSVAKRSTALYL